MPAAAAYPVNGELDLVDGQGGGEGIAVFDLATLKITDTYKANQTSYSPASAIQSYYNDK